MPLGSRGEPATLSLAGKCETPCPSVPTPEPAASQWPCLTPISHHHLPGPHSSVPPGSSIGPSPRLRGSGILDQSSSPAQRDTPTHPEQGIPFLPAAPQPHPQLALGRHSPRWSLQVGHWPLQGWKCFLHQVCVTWPQPAPPGDVASPLSLLWRGWWPQGVTLAAVAPSVGQPCGGCSQQHSWG